MAVTEIWVFFFGGVVWLVWLGGWMDEAVVGWFIQGLIDVFIHI